MVKPEKGYKAMESIKQIEMVETRVLNKYRNSITRKAFVEAINEIKEIILSGGMVKPEKGKNMNAVEINSFLCLISKLDTVESCNVADSLIRSWDLSEDDRANLLSKLEDHKRFLRETA